MKGKRKIWLAQYKKNTKANDNDGEMDWCGKLIVEVDFQDPDTIAAASVHRNCTSKNQMFLLFCCVHYARKPPPPVHPQPATVAHALYVAFLSRLDLWLSKRKPRENLCLAITCRACSMLVENLNLWILSNAAVEWRRATNIVCNLYLHASAWLYVLETREG